MEEGERKELERQLATARRIAASPLDELTRERLEKFVRELEGKLSETSQLVFQPCETKGSWGSNGEVAGGSKDRNAAQHQSRRGASETSIQLCTRKVVSHGNLVTCLAR
jgi:hypothetical protein